MIHAQLSIYVVQKQSEEQKRRSECNFRMSSTGWFPVHIYVLPGAGHKFRLGSCKYGGSAIFPQSGVGRTMGRRNRVPGRTVRGRALQGYSY